jgi:hypothetical protein
VKRSFAVFVCVLLAGCASLPSIPGAAPAASETPVVVVQTVLVTVVPTEMPTITPTPTSLPTAAPQVIVVTATPESAESPQPTSQASAVGATATLPADAGGGLFTSLTRSGDRFALRCQPDTITFGVSTDNPYVLGVDFYYRIEDRLSVSISTWQWAGSMTSDKHGNFTLDFASSRVDPDLRSHRAWFDYQFVGLNKQNDAVGRSAKIVKQITYAIDCADF